MQLIDTSWIARYCSCEDGSECRSLTRLKPRKHNYNQYSESLCVLLYSSGQASSSHTRKYSPIIRYWYRCLSLKQWVTIRYVKEMTLAVGLWKHPVFKTVTTDRVLTSSAIQWSLDAHRKAQFQIHAARAAVLLAFSDSFRISIISTLRLPDLLWSQCFSQDEAPTSVWTDMDLSL